jgi:putative transposase
MVYRLLPFQEIPTERAVVPRPQSPACGREEEDRQGSPTDGGHHGFPECQNCRRIVPPERLRRPQENLKGRKRHLLVDTLGLPLSVYVSSADVQDRVGAQCLLAGLKPFVPRLKKIWADGAYTGEKLARWCKEQGRWELEIVERSSSTDTEGFAVLPRRWIVERTFGWLIRNRRLSKDYERKVQSSETFIEVAMIRLILTRLARAA